MANDYSATSSSGSLSEALSGAIAAATQGENANFFTWRLERVSGTVGGFVGARDVTVTIRAAQPGGKALAPDGAHAAGAETCGDWHAWHNRMPGGPPVLHVVGSCTFPTAGYEVELQQPGSDGINPVIRLLEKVVRAPTGPAAQVETTIEIHYREQTSAFYAHVQIMPDNVLIPVQQVS